MKVWKRHADVMSDEGVSTLKASSNPAVLTSPIDWQNVLLPTSRFDYS